LFDWKTVIGQYQQLWAELAERRRGAAESAPRPAGHPAQPTRADPYQAFASYTTATLGPNDQITLAPDATPVALEAALTSTLVNFAKAVNPPVPELQRLLETLKDRSPTVAQLAQEWSPETRGFRARSLLWLAKLGLVRIKKG
jgi:hypothetical protein